MIQQNFNKTFPEFCIIGRDKLFSKIIKALGDFTAMTEDKR